MKWSSFISGMILAALQPTIKFCVVLNVFTCNREKNKLLALPLLPQDLGLWDKNNQFTVEPGSFSVMVGASSVDIRLKGSFEVQ